MIAPEVPHHVEECFRLPEACHRNFFFFSSRSRHTRFDCDWSSDVCSSDPDPRNWSEVRALPILQVFPDEDHELLLFADFTRIAAYGEAGLAWLADLVLDGLKILSRTGAELRIRGDTYPDSEEHLVIDVLTGEVIELPCGHRNWAPFIKPYPGRKCLICGERRLNPR